MASREGRALRLTPAARADLEHIRDHTAETWSAAQAERYVRGLQHVLDTLVAFPELARERHEFDPPVRLHPCQLHVIVYRFEVETFEVLRILHARRNWRSILEVG